MTFDSVVKVNIYDDLFIDFSEISSFTTFSKSVILLLPLTCHSPVSPGLNDILALWCGSYFSHSSSVGGRVPKYVK